MTIIERITHDLKEAMRARDKMTLGALRLITAAIKQIEVDERITVDETRMLVLLDKLAKQRKESISQFKAAHRDDLVAQEQFELELLQRYMPEPLTDAEIATLVENVVVKLDAQKISDMGRVMAELKPLLQGRADMSKVSVLIKTKLNG